MSQTRQIKYEDKLAPCGIIPFAKSSGPTSFGALWTIKHALNTNKVGHTGTLDSFADGLLVVLSGHLTHLVPHITGFTKVYQAVICFGKETDTLDPSGNIIRLDTFENTSAPSKKQIEDILEKFTGVLLQTPPVYSALHVNGQRASDIVRSGKKIQLEPRQIVVYKNVLLDYKAPSLDDSCSYALLEITCSKGTYIRALARDMAYALGTCAHLVALRRVAVGPFLLKDAACFSLLKPFTIEEAIKNAIRFVPVETTSDKKQNHRKEDESIYQDIRTHFIPFTPDVAYKCGLKSEQLKAEYQKLFINGRPLSSKMFTPLQKEKSLENTLPLSKTEIAIFYDDNTFAGMINKNNGKLNYSFVVPPKFSSNDLKVFSWEQLINGEFPIEWKNKGTAISIGSFDGMHAGHISLLNQIQKQKDMVKGIVTFRSSCKSINNGYEGDISSLNQRLKIIKEKGFNFVILIDFSDEFSRINGEDFLKTLFNFCGFKFLTEGRDFRCGYKGSVNVDTLYQLSKEWNYTLHIVDDVIFDTEKVSSSRIRKAIEESDFLTAQKMLLRPFSYDCTSCLWEKEDAKESNMLWYISKKTLDRVLPSVGVYKVSVFINDGIMIKTSFVIEKDYIKLLLSMDIDIKNVKEVTFF